MVFCAVVGCSSNNNKKCKNYNPECRYFSFPKNKSVCDAWVHKCYQRHEFNIKTARICSNHFTDNDYCLKEKLLGFQRNKWKLKPDAIPSINLIKHKNLQTKRTEKVEKRRLVKNIHEYEKLKDNEEQIHTSPETKLSETYNENKISGIRVSASSQTESFQDDSEKLLILEKECTHLKDIVEKQRKELQSFKKIFTEGQVRKLKSGKQVKWGIEDIAYTLSLYAGGPRPPVIKKKRLPEARSINFKKVDRKN